MRHCYVAYLILCRHGKMVNARHCLYTFARHPNLTESDQIWAAEFFDWGKKKNITLTLLRRTLIGQQHETSMSVADMLLIIQTRRKVMLFQSDYYSFRSI